MCFSGGGEQRGCFAGLVGPDASQSDCRRLTHPGGHDRTVRRPARLAIARITPSSSKWMEHHANFFGRAVHGVEMILAYPGSPHLSVAANQAPGNPNSRWWGERPFSFTCSLPTTMAIACAVCCWDFGPGLGVWSTRLTFGHCGLCLRDAEHERATPETTPGHNKSMASSLPSLEWPTELSLLLNSCSLCSFDL